MPLFPISFNSRCSSQPMSPFMVRDEGQILKLCLALRLCRMLDHVQMSIFLSSLNAQSNSATITTCICHTNYRIVEIYENKEVYPIRDIKRAFQFLVFLPRVSVCPETRQHSNMENTIELYQKQIVTIDWTSASSSFLCCATRGNQAP